MAKTKPHSVRFEEFEFSFICKREGLKTAQSILDFLMNEYMKIYKIEKPSIFSITNEKDNEENNNEYPLNPPPKETNQSFGNGGDYFANTEPKKNVLLSEFESFKEEIIKTETIQEVESVMKRVKGALMFPKEKTNLELIAKEHSKEFYND